MEGDLLHYTCKDCGHTITTENCKYCSAALTETEPFMKAVYNLANLIYHIFVMVGAVKDFAAKR